MRKKSIKLTVWVDLALEMDRAPSHKITVRVDSLYRSEPEFQKEVELAVLEVAKKLYLRN